MKYYLASVDLEHPRDIGGDEQNEMLSRVTDVLWQMGFTGSVKFAAAPPGEDITEGTIYRTAMGRIGVGPNGLIVDSTELDPAEVRLGAPEGQHILGKYSGDVIAAGGHRTEAASIQVCVDGRYRFDPDRRKRLRGVIFFGILDPMKRPDLAPDHDQQWVRQMAIAHDGLWLNCPHHFPGEAGGPW